MQIKTITDIPFDKFASHINKTALFYSHWKFKKQNKKLAESIFEEIHQQARKLIKGHIIYGCFKGHRRGNFVTISGDNDKRFTFKFPRQKREPKLSIANFFDKETSTIPIQIVTIGREIVKLCHLLHEADKYTDYLYYSGLAAEATDALADYCHKMILADLHLDQKTGKRFAFGYPMCPDLKDQKKIFELLKPERIGISLTETFMLDPEFSTSAIISLDPKAKYIS